MPFSEFNELNFESDVLMTDSPVLVFFTATWSAPGNAMAPLIQQISIEYDGSFKVGKLDLDDSPEIAEKYAITSAPTFIIFKNGAIAARHVGAAPMVKITSLMDAHL